MQVRVAMDEHGQAHYGGTSSRLVNSLTERDMKAIKSNFAECRLFPVVMRTLCCRLLAWFIQLRIT